MAPEPFPVNLYIVGQPVLVVGGGPVAARKIEALKRAGAEVTVVAPTAVGRIISDSAITWCHRTYRSDDVSDYRLVVTATNNPEVNAQVARDCEAANIFVNSADDPNNCSFTLMSVLRRGDLQITVSTNGRSPALARWLRCRFEQEIDYIYITMLELLAEVRAEVKAITGTSESPGWETALNDGVFELLRDSRFDEAKARLRHHLGLQGPTIDEPENNENPAIEHPRNDGITEFSKEPCYDPD